MLFSVILIFSWDFCGFLFVFHATCLILFVSSFAHGWVSSKQIGAWLICTLFLREVQNPDLVALQTRSFWCQEDTGYVATGQQQAPCVQYSPSSASRCYAPTQIAGSMRDIIVASWERRGFVLAGLTSDKAVHIQDSLELLVENKIHPRVLWIVMQNIMEIMGIFLGWLCIRVEELSPRY